MLIVTFDTPSFCIVIRHIVDGVFSVTQDFTIPMMEWIFNVQTVFKSDHPIIRCQDSEAVWLPTSSRLGSNYYYYYYF